MPSRLIPQKKSLANQTAEILREHIASGEWQEYLPPELELASRMQIGRNTLRRALADLTSAGVIEPGRSGKRRRILSLPENGDHPTTRHPIYFLTPHQEASLPAYVLRLVGELRPLLNEAEYRLQPITCKAFQLKQPRKILQRLMDEHPASAWILHCSTQPMQAFFDTAAVPTVILGMPHHGVTLPAVTPHVGAAARHAAGVLLGNGHKDITFLRSSGGLAGSDEMERAFLEAFESHRGEPAHPTVKPAPESVSGMCRTLDQLMASSRPPTALVVERVGLIPTIMTHLAQKGLLIPRDLSLVALFEDLVLDYLIPAVAHYRIDPRREMKTLVSALISTVEHGSRNRPLRTLTPEFVPGASVASRPAP